MSNSIATRLEQLLAQRNAEYLRGVGLSKKERRRRGRARSSAEEPPAHNGLVVGSNPAGHTIALPPLPVPIETPPLPPNRDFLDVSAPRHPHWPAIWEEEPRDKEVARLEHARKVQEAAWYSAGYSRDQVIRLFGNWPVNCGYPPYEWTAGFPPLGHIAWRR